MNCTFGFVLLLTGQESWAKFSYQSQNVTITAKSKPALKFNGSYFQHPLENLAKLHSLMIAFDSLKRKPSL